MVTSTLMRLVVFIDLLVLCRMASAAVACETGKW